MQIKYLRISEMSWKLKTFLTTPRKIYAVYPAITNFAVLRVTFEYGNVLNTNNEVNLKFHAVLEVAASLFSLATTYLLSRVLVTKNPRFWFIKYLLIITFGSLVIPSYWFVFLNVPLLESIILFLRLVILVSITESIAGYLLSQIELRTVQLESHQESLLLSEENFRSAVAAHFHDNLQTRLVTVGIQLNQLRPDLNDVSTQKLASIIDEIELIRSKDVRDFGRGISPQIDRDGLGPSLERLFDQYRKAISCTTFGMTSLSFLDSADQTQGLGVYRIIEQTLVNALIHGKASEFEVRATQSGNTHELVMSNNGLSYDLHSAMQGHGFAVIDAWVKKLGGSWKIENIAGQVTVSVIW